MCSFRNLTALLLVVVSHVPSYAASTLVEAAQKEDKAAIRTLLAKKADVNATAVDGTTALHWMVRAEDLDTVDALIRAGANVNAKDRYETTPLYLATSLGNTPIMEKLLTAGADPNAALTNGESLLMTSIQLGELDPMKALLKNGANVNYQQPGWMTTPLMTAIIENRPEMARLLIEYGSNVNARTKVGEKPPRRPAGAGGGSHGVGIIRSGYPPSGSQTPTQGGFTPLLYATRDGHFEIVKMLVEAGAKIEEVEANKITPLQMAISNDNVQIARYLIERGANVNSADDYGRTPLWLATELRNLEVRNGNNNGIDRPAVLELIKLLIEKGANVNARTTDAPPTRRFLMGLGDLSWVNFIGQTPFLRAALSGDVTLMKLLLQHGADPNIETEEGTTPLMAAAGVNWVVAQTYTESDASLLEAVKLCLELGADVNHANSMGLTAVHGAANRGSDAIIQFLFEKGAKLDIKDKEGRSPYVWAEGVFLATNAPVAKPSSMELIKKLLGEK